MEKYRQALERARSFEDDDEFFPGPLEAIKPTHLTTPDRPTGGSLFTPPAGPRKWRESRTKSAAIPIMQPPDAKNGQAKGGDTGLKPPPQARFWWKAPFPEDKNDEAYPYDGNW
ncbi:hypothetical protein CLAFUW4_04017 [Fulvia fulva]|uniref:Uncharacterized protein n=1 Tax=Passalora fulva TaxID=5499 RepID=A0A9Q8LE02_PASFU|nr:uncharacterized protein CLAFUR5_03982 [Fulvia fulva]KAK4626955.1 hypothetical protein CLAFUR4_04003 [Fulvia fulva]KAK4627501.1 hypothetical protein CLAFUR0_04004 [Fulvia fulva]UJO15712.1 hypothetical protein CLAFUR5_03982 [Fulvia fulva]WPV13552.1 hypothetical protein CLAFUW4_04017 [Fulvia fulva]WPV28476.1 hypothetical protein CLAFUW7_04006 [Fulvia fulva]